MNDPDAQQEHETPVHFYMVKVLGWSDNPCELSMNTIKILGYVSEIGIPNYTPYYTIVRIIGEDSKKFLFPKPKKENCLLWPTHLLRKGH